jgi:hypothetical protein
MREVSSRNISAAPGKRIAAFESYLTKLAWLTEPSDLLIDIKYNCIRSLSGYEDTDHGSTDFTTFIKNKKLPVLHLIRRNILRTLISHALARETGVWHRVKEKAPTELLPPIHLNPEKTLAAIRHADRLTRDYQEHFCDYDLYEEVVYEELVRDEESRQAGESLRTLSQFLGREPHASEPSAIWCKKTTPSDPSEVVGNWKEIVHLLDATEYGWMVENPLRAAA